MADFWGNATQGFNNGLRLGVRAEERRQDREALDNRMAIEDERYEQRFGLQKKADARAETEFNWKKEEKDYADLAERFRRNAVIAEQQSRLGNNMAAAKSISEAYNEIDNGDSVFFVQKEFESPDGFGSGDAGPGGQRSRTKGSAFDGLPKDVNVAMISKQHGVIPFKSMKDAIKMVKGLATKENVKESTEGYHGHYQKENAKLAVQPKMGRDGKPIIIQYVQEEDENGEIEYVPKEFLYTGNVAIDGKTDAERANEQKSKAIKYSGEQLADFERRIKIASQPFMKSGSSPLTYDSENRAIMSGEGQTAYENAKEVLRDPTSTPELKDKAKYFIGYVDAVANYAMDYDPEYDKKQREKNAPKKDEVNAAIGPEHLGALGYGNQKEKTRPPLDSYKN